MSQEHETTPVRPPDLPQGPVSGGAPQIPVDPPITPLSAEVNVRIRETTPEEDSPNAGALAPFNSRIIAGVIDMVVAGGLMMAALWILPGFATKLGWLLGIAYLVTRDSLPFLKGRSVGKTAMKLKVVTLDDKDLIGNWEAAIVRNAVLAIPFFPFVELFVLLSREDKPERGRRLGDEWSKTKVIIAPDPVAETAE